MRELTISLKIVDIVSNKYPIANSLTIHQKINFRYNAIINLEIAQYFQLVNRKSMIIAPYYKDRLIAQSKEIEEAENFKSIFGKSRYQYENNF